MTPAINFLNKRRIPYHPVEYEHLEKGARFAARAIGIPLERTIKTLVVELEPEGPCLVLMPGDKKISFKKFAKMRQVKRAVMIDTHSAEKLTGYRVGGISPFGVKKKLPVFIEAGLLAYDEVAINGGRRGVMLLMKPSDIVAALEARTVEL